MLVGSPLFKGALNIILIVTTTHHKLSQFNYIKLIYFKNSSYREF